MTDEQIKQNAEQYALKKTLISTDSFHGMAESYLEGAHSRDKEIKEIRRCIHEFEVANKLLTHDKRNLQHELDKLRNPWISVEERLPEKWKRIKVHSGTGEECYSWITKDVFVIKDGWETPEIAFYDYDAKIWWSEYGDNIENIFGEPTHWMPIPETPSNK